MQVLHREAEGQEPGIFHLDPVGEVGHTNGRTALRVVRVRQGGVLGVNGAVQALRVPGLQGAAFLLPPDATAVAGEDIRELPIAETPQAIRTDPS